MSADTGKSPLLYVLSYSQDGQGQPSFTFWHRSFQALEMALHIVDQGKLGRTIEVGEVMPPKLEGASIVALWAPLYAGLNLPRGTAPAGSIERSEAISPQELRRRAKERAAERRAAEPAIPETPAGWEKCPGCLHPYDPAATVLFNCPECQEQKCSARCIKAEGQTCSDCIDFRDMASSPDGDDGTQGGSGEGAAAATSTGRVAGSASPATVREVHDPDLERMEREADKAAAPFQAGGRVVIPATQFHRHIFDDKPPAPPKDDR